MAEIGEGRLLGGQRLDAATDGRPDSRPLVGENLGILGDLRDDLDSRDARDVG